MFFTKIKYIRGLPRNYINNFILYVIKNTQIIMHSFFTSDNQVFN